ncbi:hypothetical protein [Pseudomonas sp. RIT-PI-AD]|uniref:hypothetical protein n=1 Tax=Pseudomonas sp. RIT-PI-AD TaxID=3035294 RepID=UPI0021DB52EC|nr:hypothetical protein [Pseudomonas sp. RIT-PI-AD]
MKRRGLWRIFRWPLLLAVLISLGLVAGLMGDGFADLFAWLALGAPLALIGWIGARLRSS